MGIKFGDIDSGQILENEFRIGVLEKLVEFIVNNNATLNKPNPEQIEEIKQLVAANLKEKYPNSGISIKKK